MSEISIEHDGRQIACHCIAGRSPGVLFCGGFKSSMQGNKALALEALCQSHGIACTRFDYSGHGQSSGEFKDGNIDTWLSDTLAVIDRVATGSLVVVGSSMGAWLATLAAIQRPARVAALITIAAAPDFTERLLPLRLSTLQRESLQNGEPVLMPSEYDDGSAYPITPQLIANSQRHCLLDSAQGIKLDIPVRLLHGTADPDVPYALSIELMDTLSSSDGQLVLVKNGDHRLSDQPALELLEATLLALCSKLTALSPD